jgi:hypothetical protein
MCTEICPKMSEITTEAVIAEMDADNPPFTLAEAERWAPVLRDVCEREYTAGLCDETFSETTRGLAFAAFTHVVLRVCRSL